jgi:hypothetical protein
LRELINALFNETDRLGYTVEEVKQALDEQINK